MQKLTTFHFGEIEYDEQKIINFPNGIPGFPNDKRFLFMSEDENEDTFFWLQSVDNGDVAFTLMNVYGVLPNYDPHVDEEEMKELGDVTDSPLEIYNIAVIPEDAKQMRVNLMAPVVINMEAGLGRQVVCTNDDYPIRYYIFEELEKFRREGVSAEC